MRAMLVPSRVRLTPTMVRQEISRLRPFSSVFPPNRRSLGSSTHRKNDVVDHFFSLSRTRPREQLREWAGTVVAHSPASTTPDEMLTQIPDSQNSFMVTTIVLLFTTCLAHLANEGFVQQALSCLCRQSLMNSTSQDVVHVIYGIVDKVPGTKDNNRPGSAAAEGLSILLSNSHMHQDMRVNHSKTSDSNEQPDHPALLRFSSRVDRLGYSTTLDAGHHYGVHQVQVPVANSIFVNGQASTIFESFWERSKKPSNEGFRLRLPPRSLAGYTINVPVTPAVMTSPKHSLQVVTEPRMLTSTMGNIIREIEVDGKGVPASSELEPAVTQIARQRGLDDVDVKILVFALVRPRSGAIIKLSDNSGDQSVRGGMKRHIDRGARLYRVTGGGGGWGSKRGLLSLEPATSFEGLSPEEGSGSFKGAQQEEFLPSAIMNSAEDTVVTGELVQFFVYSGDRNKAREDASDTLQGASAEGTTRSPSHEVVLGNIAPAETVTDSNVQHKKESTNNRFAYLEQVFGAFSERGIGIVIKEKQDLTYGGGSLGSGASNVLSSTKFDVPGARFRLPTYSYEAKRPLKLSSDSYALSEARFENGIMINNPKNKGTDDQEQQREGQPRDKQDGRYPADTSGRKSRAQRSGFEDIIIDGFVPKQGEFADLGNRAAGKAEPRPQREGQPSGTTDRPKWET